VRGHGYGDGVVDSAVRTARRGRCGVPVLAVAVVLSVPSMAVPAAARPLPATAASTAAPASSPLHGRTVVIDPGHNGANASHPRRIARLVWAGGFRKPCDTTGTVTRSGLRETTYAYWLANRLAGVLRHRGAHVVLTRTSNTGVGPCINRRARIGNEAEADAVVSVHADGAARGVHGFHVIEPALAPNGRNAAILRPSARLAHALRLAFHRGTAEPYATYLGDMVRPGLTRRADLGGLNLSRVPKVFLECGNMQNRADARHLRSREWRHRAARAIADGIAAFLAVRR
jgi:N-acetylmuramoyl-L-alanine amidase